HAGAGDGSVAQPGAALFFADPVAVRFLIDEVQRISRHQVGVPLLKGAFVEELGDAFAGGNVPVVSALGTNAQPPFGFFPEDGGLASWAAPPEALGYAALGSLEIV